MKEVEETGGSIAHAAARLERTQHDASGQRADRKHEGAIPADRPALRQSRDQGGIPVVTRAGWARFPRRLRIFAGIRGA